MQRELSPKVTEGLFVQIDNPSPLSAELPLHRGAFFCIINNTTTTAQLSIHAP